MVDFLMISTRSTKRGVMEIYPKFIIRKSSDLMIRGGDFYAIWIEERGLWSTDEQDALQLIDRELDHGNQLLVKIDGIFDNVYAKYAKTKSCEKYKVSNIFHSYVSCNF